MTDFEHISNYTGPYDYNNPLPKDYLCFNYKPIEEVFDWSYGELVHIHYKERMCYATRLNGIIKPILKLEDANKQYRFALEQVLKNMEEIQLEDQLSDSPF
jgi:hypothetical protein